MAVFTVIQETTLSASAQSITMSSIPSSYDHLYLVVSTRESNTSYSAEMEFRFNSSSSPYSNTYLQSTTGAPTSYRDTSVGDVIGLTAGGSILSDTFSNIIMWIPHYANTSNGKQVFIQSVAPNSSTTANEWFLRLTAGLWNNTAAINALRMQGAGSGSLVVGTSMVLYGIKGA
jgi:hypothetical protein